MSNSIPKYNFTRVATSALLKTGAGRVMAVQLNGGSTAASLAIHNTVDGSGTAIYEIAAPFTDDDASAASTVFADLQSVEGVDLSAYIYAKLAGTGAVAYVWWT